LSTSLWCQRQTSSSFMNFCCFRLTSISPPMSQSHLTSARTTCWPLDTQNLFKLSPALIYTHAFTSETPSFAREGKWWRRSVFQALVPGSGCVGVGVGVDK
jgi:hypothetical protein